MKVIIAPARTMKIDEDSFPYQDLPEFLPETEQILAWMRSLSYVLAIPSMIPSA